MFNQAVLAIGPCLLQNRKRVDTSSGNVVVYMIGRAWKRLVSLSPLIGHSEGRPSCKSIGKRNAPSVAVRGQR